ncbi:FtsX-like permease family protein [bacterium]|nr:FtsX-like permease family protein [bacterium]
MMDVKKLAELARTDEGPVKIQRQMSLPWKDAFRISIKNVTLRLGRAAITASGVVLGIAFLMSIWTSRVCTDGIERYEAQSARAVNLESGPGGEAAKAEKVQRTARQNWLVVMSLLVCMVGITNSMLMSVTERFREIGTMKCLGALDAFIVRLFLIETALMGFLGSLVGGLLGLLVMLIVFTIKDHSVAAKMDWGQLAIYLAVSLSIGIVVSLCAAVIPAMGAAKMPAAAALQSEV